MTTHGTAPEDPGPRQPGKPQVPARRLSPEDLLELHEPYDLPDLYCDFDPPRLPPNAIVIDQIRGRPGAAPSLAELLESIRARAREPEPDREAEP